MNSVPRRCFDSNDNFTSFFKNFETLEIEIELIFLEPPSIGPVFYFLMNYFLGTNISLVLRKITSFH